MRSRIPGAHAADGAVLELRGPAFCLEEELRTPAQLLSTLPVPVRTEVGPSLLARLKLAHAELELAHLVWPHWRATERLGGQKPGESRRDSGCDSSLSS